jgi:hypothetical protein
VNKTDTPGKDPGVCQPAGFAEQEKEWHAPCLTVWEVVRDTSMAYSSGKNASGPDSQGMRDVIVP